MMSEFKLGDHVSWNSPAGRVSGRITAIHRADFKLNGYTRHCSADDPQYEIASDRTGHVAYHKAGALTKVG